jgi:hypothetical protein
LMLCAQVAIAAWILARDYPPQRIALYLSLAIVTMVAVTPYQDYYTGFFGEGPAFGFLLIAAALLSSEQIDRTTVAVAGLCFSLALLTKLVALFCAAGIAGVWLLRELCDPREAVRRTLLLCVATLAPLAVFELIKLAVLGSNDYIANWHAFVSITETLHEAPAERIARFLEVLRDDYTFDRNLIGFALCVGVATFLLPEIRSPFGLTLLGGATAHVIYIFCISSMMVRYFWLGIVMLAFAVAAPALSLRWRSAAVYLTAFFLLWATPHRFWDVQWQARAFDGSTLRAQRAILSVIDSYPNLPIVSQWWGTIDDVIYLLPGQRKWYATNDVADLTSMNTFVVLNNFAVRAAEPTSMNVLVVLNDNFAIKDSTFYKTLVATCKPINGDMPVYKAFLCSPSFDPFEYDNSARQVFPAESCFGGIQEINGGPPKSSGITASGVLKVKGWLVKSVEQEAPLQSVLVVLTDDNGRNVFVKTRQVQRPEVAAYYKKPALAASGFTSVADISILEGNYTLGFALVEGDRIEMCDIKAPLMIKKARS